MLSNLLLSELNKQFTHERQNEAFYMAQADQFEAQVWHGFSKWAHKQAADETSHARRIADYIIDRGRQPDYLPLTGVNVINGILPTFQAAYELEQDTTSALKTLYYLAETQEDPQTCIFLHGLLLEQVEEEKVLYDAVIEVGRATDNASLLLLDGRYGS